MTSSTTSIIKTRTSENQFTILLNFVIKYDEFYHKYH